MIALARNRKAPPQRQTAQHVTNRRAELFLFGRGANRLSEGRDFDCFGQTIAVFEEIHWGKWRGAVRRRTFRASRVRELGD